MGDSNTAAPMLRPSATCTRRRKPNAKKTQTAEEDRVPYPLEEDPAEEDPIFRPAGLPHFRNGVDK
jgi:hypothetical protein